MRLETWVRPKDRGPSVVMKLLQLWHSILTAPSPKPEGRNRRLWGWNGQASLRWRLGARPGLTRFPAPSASGRDSCPPECQDQGGA
jgi:hypothetical protein